MNRTRPKNPPTTLESLEYTPLEPSECGAYWVTPDGKRHRPLSPAHKKFCRLYVQGLSGQKPPDVQVSQNTNMAQKLKVLLCFAGILSSLIISSSCFKKSVNVLLSRWTRILLNFPGFVTKRSIPAKYPRLSLPRSRGAGRRVCISRRRR